MDYLIEKVLESVEVVKGASKAVEKVEERKKTEKKKTKAEESKKVEQDEPDEPHQPQQPQEDDRPEWEKRGYSRPYVDYDTYVREIRPYERPYEQPYEQGRWGRPYGHRRYYGGGGYGQRW